MSATEASTHTVMIKVRVEADKGTRRTAVLAAVRERARSLRLPDDAGCRADLDSLSVYFEDISDNLAAERGW